MLTQPYIKPNRTESASKDDADIFQEGKKSMSRGYLITFVSLICLVTGIQLANEFNANTYLPTYLIRNNAFSQEKAAYCQALLAFATMAGRIVVSAKATGGCRYRHISSFNPDLSLFQNIFLTMKIGIQSFLFINFASMLFGNALIWTLGSYSLYGIYSGIVFLGFGFR